MTDQEIAKKILLSHNRGAIRRVLADVREAQAVLRQYETSQDYYSSQCFTLAQQLWAIRCEVSTWEVMIDMMDNKEGQDEAID
jgi:hypothetical protein